MNRLLAWWIVWRSGRYCMKHYELYKVKFCGGIYSYKSYEKCKEMDKTKKSKKENDLAKALEVLKQV